MRVLFFGSRVYIFFGCATKRNETNFRNTVEIEYRHVLYFFNNYTRYRLQIEYGTVGVAGNAACVRHSLTETELNTCVVVGNLSSRVVITKLEFKKE